MSTMGPEDRERFARRDEVEAATSSRPAVHGEHTDERKTSAKAVAGGSLTEALCGAGTLVLAIIGLAGVLPGYLASIATIVFGVALLAHGSAIAARYSRLTHETAPFELDTRTELGGGMGALLLGGAAGIVLGILAVLGLIPATLIPTAVILYGASLLIGSAASIDLSTLGEPHVGGRFAHDTRRATVAATGTQALAGIAAIVLGILVLIGLAPLALTFVALIVLGGAVLLTGSALSTRMVGVLRR